MAPSAISENGSSADGARTKLDDKAIPYQGEQPYGMGADLVIPAIMDIEGTDDRLWVSSYTDCVGRASPADTLLRCLKLPTSGSGPFYSAHRKATSSTSSALRRVAS
jgi:hypothetical protein